MVKLVKKYMPGAKVFAKVRGYPPWPARIESVSDPNSKNAKYKVYFYGTGETATCKVDEIFEYHENKEKFGKPIKRKNFHQGIEQLEQELNNDLRKSSIAVLSESEGGNHPTATEASGATNVDSDLETGPLVIDEGDKKKPLKRKSIATTSLSALEPSDPKKKRRGKSLSVIENVPEIQVEEMMGKEVVSRSGRKIKPKRFADFSANSEYEVDTTGRNRAKIKPEETFESIPAPSSVPAKKRTSIEKEDKRAIKPNIDHQKIRVLRMESQLLKLDVEIKTALALQHAEVEKCLMAIEDILRLPLTCLMLKKHPHVVETFKKMRRYIGNLPEWNLTEEEAQVFKQKAEQIREKAEDVYAKFGEIFMVPEGQTLWQYFSNQLDQFKQVTKRMSEEQLFGLLSDPTESESVVELMSGDEATGSIEANTVKQEIFKQSAMSVEEAPIIAAK